MSTRLISRANAEDLFAKKTGEYPNLTAGTAEGLTGQSYEVDQSAYNYRKSHEGGRVREQIVGGTVAWNQLFGDIDVIGSSTAPVFTASVLENNAGFNAVLNTDLTDGNNTSRAVYYRCTDFSLVSGHKYLFIGNIKTNITSIYRVNGYWTPFADDAIGNGMSAISDKCYYTMFIANTTRSGSFTHRLYLYGTNGTTGQYFDYEDIQSFDLTAMFGSTIADYIYSLEQTTAGAGVAWLKQYIDLDTYHEYNAGSLESVQTEGREVVGFNQLDKDASYTIDGVHYRYFDLPIGATNTLYISFTDKDTSVNVSDINFGFVSTNYGTATSYIWNMQSGVIRPNHSNVTNAGSSGVFGIKSQYAFMYPNTNDALTRLFKRYDICINLSDPAKNGTYKPYEKRTYPVSNIELRGIPKLVDNQLAFDGDVYAADGTVTRKYGIVDLGTLTWTYDNSQSDYNFFRAPLNSMLSGTVNMILAGYTVTTGRTTMTSNMMIAPYSQRICVRNDLYSDAESFKAAMNGVYLVYELATPTTETADPYAPVQAVGDTERWIDNRDVPVPVGQNSKYYPDYAEKIDGLPSDFSTLIAPTEATYTATRNYAVGDYFIVDNVLYSATAAISTGTAITPDSNCRAVTIMELIKEILDAL